MANDLVNGGILGAAVVATIAAASKIAVYFVKYRAGSPQNLLARDESQFGYYKTQLLDARTRITELDKESDDLRRENHDLHDCRRKLETTEHRLDELCYYLTQLDSVARDDRATLIVKYKEPIDQIPPPPRWMRDAIKRHKQRAEEE